MSQSSYFFPYFQLKYFEYDQQVDKSAELLSDLIIIDGLFYSAGDTNKFCLGYQSNLARTEKTRTYLSQLGYGIGFSKNEDDQLFVKSLTQLPVYLLTSDNQEPIYLGPGESKKLFDMGPFIRNTQLPPKKKTLNQSDLTVRISFGEDFAHPQETPPPCWCQLNLIKFVDVNILKNI